MPPETKTLGMVAYAAYFRLPADGLGPPEDWEDLDSEAQADWEAVGAAVAAWPSEATIPVPDSP